MQQFPAVNFVNSSSEFSEFLNNSEFWKEGFLKQTAPSEQQTGYQYPPSNSVMFLWEN